MNEQLTRRACSTPERRGATVISGDLIRLPVRRFSFESSRVRRAVPFAWPETRDLHSTGTRAAVVSAAAAR